MKLVCIAVVFLLSRAATESVRYDGHQVLKIFPKTQTEAKHILNLVEKYGLDIWHVHHNDSTFDVRIFPELMGVVKQELNNINIPFHTWIHDVQSLIDKEMVHDEYHVHKRATAQTFMFSTYHTFENIEYFLNELTASDSIGPSGDTIKSTKDLIGHTVEGRTIHMIKIWKESGTVKRSIFVDGGIHAREWISPAFLLYLIDQLKNNPDRLASIEELVDQYDWYLVPVLNPDGYSYSHTSTRLWRKNRRLNAGSTCHGVDLNRNFGYQWNPATGGSTNPCSDVYSGAGAFSEAESSAVRDFFANSNIDFISYLTVHSYGQMWLYPWGYTAALPVDHLDLDNAAITATDVLYQRYRTRYSVGSSTNVLYAAAGGSDDYAKGGAGIKYAYTLELRDTGRYGFVLPVSQLIPTCEETMDAFIAFVNHLKTAPQK